MIHVRMLQLGDIHMGMSRDSSVDLKDRKYPAPVASLTTNDPLISSARCAVSLVRARPVDVILLVGDLAHQGDSAEYQKCVDYLVDNLLGDWCKGRNSAFCVPGNHDINRDTILPDTTPDKIWEKFAPLEAAWTKHKLPILATSDVKTLTFTKGAATVEIMALNSCLGCGEYRGLPNALRKAAHGIVSKAGSRPSKWTTIEQLDSPAFAIDHLETTQKKLEGERKVNVLLAHHNLLPQATPRAAPYAELFNGGQFRSMLSGARNPTLYCHGHIHDDPIEIVSVPETRFNPMVSVSAPLLDQGFNVLELVFTDGGVPLGTIVQKYKIGRSHTFSHRPHEEVRIPFRSSAEYFPLFQPPRSDMIELIRAGDGARFPTLLAQMQQRDSTVTEPQLAIILLEAEWYGLVEIGDRDNPPPSWRINRASL